MSSTLYQAATLVLPLVFAIVFHEVSHGWTARALGDPTAYERGRLSLNPLKHVDPVGTLLLPGATRALADKGIPHAFSSVMEAVSQSFPQNAAGIENNARRPTDKHCGAAKPSDATTSIATVAELVVRSAMARKESRGLHYNLDHPTPDHSRVASDTLLQRNVAGISPTFHVA